MTFLSEMGLIYDQPVVHIGKRSGLVYAHLVPEWAEAIQVLERASYPTANHEDLYDVATLTLLANEYGHGCFIGFDISDPETGLDQPKLVAMGLGVQTDFDLENPQHDVHDIIPKDLSSSGVDPNGDWYYGTGIAVDLDYRRRGIGAELYELRKSVCIRDNLMGIVAGGVMPGYADHTDTMSADDYIKAVIAGDLYDPTLTFQKDNGFALGPALPGYIRDPKVNNTASLIVWHSPCYDPQAPSCYDPNSELFEGDIQLD